MRKEMVSGGIRLSNVRFAAMLSPSSSLKDTQQISFLSFPLCVMDCV